MYKVINTINSDVQEFEKMELVKAHIASEIKWFNSPSENENNNGYDESDFIVEEVKFVIADETSEGVKYYNEHESRFGGDLSTATTFDTKELADAFILASEWSEWAYVTTN